MSIGSQKISIEIIGDADRSYSGLKAIAENQVSKGVFASAEMKIIKGIHRMIGLLQQDPLYGENAKKHLIPKYYIDNYGAKNIRIADLPLFWRMVYTILGSSTEVKIFVLDIFSHDDYNERFGFKER